MIPKSILPKKVVFVSNYFNTRVGLYVNGTLRYEEHGRIAYMDCGDGKWKQVGGRDIFQHAADILTLVGVKFSWVEADITWLKNRKRFPKTLAQVKFE